MSEKAKVFKKLEGMNAGIEFVSPAKLDQQEFKGLVVEGEYVGTVPNQYNEDAPSFKFVKNDETVAVINSCGSLKYQMSLVSIGDTVQIIYKGKNTAKSGKLKGKAIHEFEVLKAD